MSRMSRNKNKEKRIFILTFLEIHSSFDPDNSIISQCKNHKVLKTIFQNIFAIKLNGF